MTNLSPYNITITSDSPTVSYLPYRDGPVAGGWNMSCSSSDPSTFSVEQTLCLGVASRRSAFVGASMSIDFEGTAAYLYGTGNPSSFVFQVDNQVRNNPLPDISSGLLAKAEGLAYGQHRIYVNVTQSTTTSIVSFDEAVLTIGVGQQSSTQILNRTIVPFTPTILNGGAIDLPTINPQFNYTGTWNPDVQGTFNGVSKDITYPRITSGEFQAFVTFEISQASAFFIYGIVNVDLGQFSVTLSTPGFPSSSLGQPITGFYNSNAHYINVDRVMYWKSGLDRDVGYLVKVTNLGQGSTPFWVFNRVELLDGGPGSVSTGVPNGPQSQPAPPSSSRHKVSAPVGLIAGSIVRSLPLPYIIQQPIRAAFSISTQAGGLFLIIVSIAGLVWYRKRNLSSRKKDAIETSSSPYSYTSPRALHFHTTDSDANQPHTTGTGSSATHFTDPSTSSGLTVHSTGSPLTHTTHGPGRHVKRVESEAPGTREVDAGALTPPRRHGESVFLQPPDYSDSWTRGGC